SIREKQFHCPRCGVLSHQDWYQLLGKWGDWRTISTARVPVRPVVARAAEGSAITRFEVEGRESEIPTHRDRKKRPSRAEVKFDGYLASLCANCGEAAIWHDDQLIDPVAVAGVPPANDDLNPEIKQIYAEAAAIISTSPRGAAALLRLGVQQLCIQ